MCVLKKIILFVLSVGISNASDQENNIKALLLLANKDKSDWINLDQEEQNQKSKIANQTESDKKIEKKRKNSLS